MTWLRSHIVPVLLLLAMVISMMLFTWSWATDPIRALLFLAAAILALAWLVTEW